LIDQREERLQFLSGLLDVEMLTNARVAQPPHNRSDTDGALEPLNCGDAGDLRLPKAKTDLSDDIQALEGLIALDCKLNGGCFWPVARLPGMPAAPRACSSR
jgi:hypothetical protein